MNTLEEKLKIDVKPTTSYCVDLAVRDSQIRANCKRIKGRVEPYDGLINESCAIVGFGPSLKKTWKEIRKFKNIFTCSGSHKFLLDQGLKPSDFKHFYHSDVDPRPHKTQLLGTPQHSIKYLMASCLHKTVFDLLEGYDVKLWHIFAVDGESEQVIPRGEWSVTGGSDAAMRCITLARILGYTDMHIFGMDGNITENSHAADHPNTPKNCQELEYEGVTYKTTPGLLSSAQQVFHEFDQLKDVKFKFYGTGLIQHMAQKYKRKPVPQSLIAFNKPELISEKMRRLNAELHHDNVNFGIGDAKYAETVKAMLAACKTEDGTPPSFLNYGSGKGALAKALSFPIFEYDPAIPGKDDVPRPADVVGSFDVLEHVEPDKIKLVLDDLRRVIKQCGYFVIHMGAAVKTYSDGTNTHLLQKDAKWWNVQLSKFFTINKLTEHGPELHVVVSPKVVPQPEITKNGSLKFLTPNDITKWRAKTLLTKEPITIQWLDTINEGDVLFDVGANVGGYSVYAGAKGVKTYAFEPEAENYALLVQNLALNGLNASAYCLAISDKQKVDSLHMSSRQVGGSCHTFGEAVGAFGEHRNGNHPIQGCVGMALDELITRGLPQPNHIKIDVDGFEPNVIKGAHKTLKKVKSLLVEVNPALPDHLAMIKNLEKMGFTYDQSQVDEATRKDGNFKGVAEYVFYREDPAAKHIKEAIANAKLIQKPYPHLVIDDLLPEVEYERLLASLPPDDKYISLKKARGTSGYPERFIADMARATWVDALYRPLLNKFGVMGEYTDEHLLIRDKIGYNITPHTDMPARILSMILYLGDGEDGTVLYEPKTKKFHCERGIHYPLNLFKKVKTVEYKGNRAFIFLRTDRSFHGVEPSKSERNVFLYDIRRAT